MARRLTLQAWLDGSLSTALDRLTRRRRPGLPAPQVLVVSPQASFSGAGAEQPFHTASIAKVFSATLIGVLVQQQRLALQSPVGACLPAAELAALPAAPGVDLRRDLTVEQLLSHRSGLPDPFLPPRGHRTACSLTSLPKDPQRRWTLDGFLAEASGLPPLGRPGQKFHYSDAGYALLLRVAEEVGEAPAGELLRRFIFEPSGMAQTHQPHLTWSAAGLAELDIAPMWLGRSEVSRIPALSFGSVDGGAVTTAADLVRFQRALHGGHLIPAELLARLAQPQSRLRPGIHYGTGLVTLRFGEFMPGFLRGLPEPVGGLGLTANHAFYYPHLDGHVILNFHSTQAMNASFRVHISIARALARAGQRRELRMAV